MPPKRLAQIFAKKKVAKKIGIILAASKILLSCFYYFTSHAFSTVIIMQKSLFLLLLLVAWSSNFASAQHSTDKLHDDWDALLRAHVNTDGFVNYAGMQTDKAKLDAYLAKLQKNTPNSKWSREDKIAYWINLYNAFTIQQVVGKYPNLKSIMDLEGGKVWTVAKVNVGGKDYTLDVIEKEILIKELKEPRVHFAVNCAAASCPPLMNAAWRADDLENRLEQRTKTFINNNKFNKITMIALEVSPIFEWYAADFGDVKAFISKYAINKLPAFGTMKYKKYDWSLNAKPVK
jgi:hypothetical protein